MVTQYVLCEIPFELSNVMQISLGIQGVIFRQINPPPPSGLFSADHSTEVECAYVIASTRRNNKHD